MNLYLDGLFNLTKKKNISEINDTASIVRCISSLAKNTQLEVLVIWESTIGNKGAIVKALFIFFLKWCVDIISFIYQTFCEEEREGEIKKKLWASFCLLSFNKNLSFLFFFHILLNLFLYFFFSKGAGQKSTHK